MPPGSGGLPRRFNFLTIVVVYALSDLSVISPNA